MEAMMKSLHVEAQKLYKCTSRKLKTINKQQNNSQKIMISSMIIFDIHDNN